MALKQNLMNIEALFLEDPETGERMEIASGIIFEGGGYYSFIVTSPDGKRKWKHTIRTVDLTEYDLP